MTLDELIQALDPDALDVEPARAAAAATARLAETMARILAACAAGEVEPHHAKWQLASAALTLRQVAEPVALEAARHELECLLPRRADSAQPPTLEEAQLVHPTSLVRKPD
jgi:hypothetical protein